ncbi:MAG: M56 family metallopeptidase, partial [Chitinophagaceae bacterium]
MNPAALFSGPLAQALLWTLVHSLWQGAAVALLAALGLAVLRRHSAALRYRYLVALALLFAAGTVATFCTLWQLPAKALAAAGTGSVHVSAGAPFVAARSLAESRWEQVVDFLNAQAPLLLMAWLLFLLVRTGMLVIGYRQSRRLRHEALEAVPAAWTARFDELVRAMGIARPVAFFQSALVQVPLVVGHLKPVVLVPLGMCTQLRPDEVQAILVHELAHIRRHDYLVNALQHVLELFYFFNPPLMWLSARIRREREYCCDDIAVAHAGSPRAYAEALLGYQEAAAGHAFAAAFHGGRRMPLLDRIQRILSSKHQNLNTMEKITLFSGLVATALVTLAFQAQDGDAPIPLTAPP